MLDENKKLNLKNCIFKLKDEIYFYEIASLTNLDLCLDYLASIVNQKNILIVDFSNLNDLEIINLACKIRQISSINESLFIVYSRPDIAKITEADGICLDDNSMCLNDAKKILNSNNLFIYKGSSFNQVMVFDCQILNQCNSFKENIFKLSKTAKNISVYRKIV